MNISDIHSVASDLIVPTMTIGYPTPGKRVKQVTPDYESTEVYHSLYLPPDWRFDKSFPVIVEYTGNGGYKNQYGDICTGLVEDSKLGYGISGGEGFIWVCMPFLNEAGNRNAERWWGDEPTYNPQPTIDYCYQTIKYVCNAFNGDQKSVILSGFSRGAIACNYIGLYNDEIAKLWLAFIVYSHYDGVYQNWGKEATYKRLKRLNGRAQFICSENDTLAGASLANTINYLKSTGINAPFTFTETGFRNHNDAWVLRPSPARTLLRQWLKQILEIRPGF
ncbi:MAG: hypothetical protein QG641_736 [Candidatus Poribacteria bacterium]|nr:hypothetical protein [Candidatus Poribacteria bacterium]